MRHITKAYYLTTAENSSRVHVCTVEIDNPKGAIVLSVTKPNDKDLFSTVQVYRENPLTVHMTPDPLKKAWFPEHAFRGVSRFSKWECNSSLIDWEEMEKVKGHFFTNIKDSKGESLELGAEDRFGSFARCEDVCMGRRTASEVEAWKEKQAKGKAEEKRTKAEMEKAMAEADKAVKDLAFVEY
ncbi:hypothetical protein BGX23_008021 [Mortierella sp. AD031]|nr:hypothetical protein BGX23_008021 [Mortierella sp. AD031]